MNVLVINCGSSSLKFQLINSESEAVLAKGLCERIGIDGRLTYQPAGGEKNVSEKAMPTHTEAIQFVIDALTDADTGVVKSLDEIGAVGHRVVHGGEKFAKSVVVTPEVKAAIAECNDLAPLHNPANLIGIEACESLMPGTPQVVVFDTAFHQTMPEKAYMYGLPYEYYEKYKVRRYGFKFFFCPVDPAASDSKRMRRIHQISHHKTSIIKICRSCLIRKYNKNYRCTIKRICVCPHNFCIHC